MELVARPNQDILIDMVNGDKAKLRSIIVTAINENGSILAASRHLGVTNMALHYWIKSLNIDVSTKAE